MDHASLVATVCLIVKNWEQLSWDHVHIFVKTISILKFTANMDHICDQINRTGQLYGKCSEGYAPARMEVYVYSVLITSTTGLNILQLLIFRSQCFIY